MIKQAIIQKHFQKIDQLSIKNPTYRRCVDDLCEWLLKYDMVQRDLTSRLLFPQTPHDITARIITKQEITVAGMEEVKYLLDTFTDIHAKVRTEDGRRVDPEQVMLELQGSPAEILAYERTMLNILQRLSGVATLTHTVVDKIHELNPKNPPLVAATRKTHWTLLDKKAVSLGGGGTHRLNLGDGVLVKDNHLLLLKDLYGLESEPELAVKTIEILLQKADDRLIEIEVEQRGSLDALIAAASKIESTNTLCIMFDNFTPQNVKSIVEDLQKKYDLTNIIFEASGGITSGTIGDWAQAGVDVLSLGALTHSAKAVDLSLDVM